MEAAKGVKRTIEIPHLEQCASCGGSGAKAGTSPQTCHECHGSGQVRVSQRTPFGMIQTAKACPPAAKG
jgi:molecular chaperone DnaJ